MTQHTSFSTRPLALGSALAALFLPTTASWAEHAQSSTALPQITVTGTRESRLIDETPASVSTLDGESLRDQRPTHPSQILNQMPGVWMSTLSGEGHSTAIRQPLTTSPMYLYLEDGIPTRSTGFFNHNALYEVNVPQSDGLEVTRGPGSALYGSDAIGGMVNVLTRAPGKTPEADLSLEAGSFGWQRALGSVSTTWNDGRDGLRASLNLTRTDGWADDAGYDRQALNLRWDRQLDSGASLRTVLAGSHVDQNHVGSLNPAEYRATPKHNNIPFSYRTVDALRLSTTWEKTFDNTLVSITPYVRDNRMEIIPSWSVSYDPTSYDTSNVSVGLLAKVRQDFAPMRARVIAGIDIDHSPGSREEDSIKLASSLNALGGRDYRIDSSVAPVRVYDYDVTYQGISPYLHGEFSPVEPLRITLGVRYDDMRYDYDNNLANAATRGVLGAFPASGWYGHAPSQEVSYSHTSPKLGATWQFTPALSMFVSWVNAFRAPSESQVFRGSRESTALRAQTQALSLLDLKPVEVDNQEIGVRYHDATWQISLAAYDMRKEDDIISYQDATAQRRTVNAGETRHRGVELALGARINDDWRVDLSLSDARHTYESWTLSGTTNYSGNDMESAPEQMGQLSLSYTPAWLNGGDVRLSWQHIGEYWLDPANTQKYDGHTLLGLRANWPVDTHWSVYAQATNLTDKRYAETASLNGTTPSYLAGQGRFVAAGAQYRW
jgi:iron complex outermembrane recepter protein